MDTSQIRIATYNIRNTMDRYPERKEILKKTVQDIQADLIGLQEVAFGEGGQLDHLLQDQNGQQLYQQYNGKMQISWQQLLQGEIAKECRLDGNSVVVKNGSNIKIVSSDLLHLSLVRVAQLLEIELQNGRKFYYVNTHLHHTIEDANIRLHQCEQLIQWLKIKIPSYLTANIIVAGDFNANPQEQSYNFFEQEGYDSLYKKVHGKEPEITFPTGLKSLNMDTDPENCLDYIWIKGNIKPSNCHIFGHLPLETDGTIYPSDHMGLYSDIEII